jgi:hypothetical protein
MTKVPRSLDDESSGEEEAELEKSVPQEPERK